MGHEREALHTALHLLVRRLLVLALVQHGAEAVGQRPAHLARHAVGDADARLLALGLVAAGRAGLRHLQLRLLARLRDPVRHALHRLRGEVSQLVELALRNLLHLHGLQVLLALPRHRRLPERRVRSYPVPQRAGRVDGGAHVELDGVPAIACLAVVVVDDVSRRLHPTAVHHPVVAVERARIPAGPHAPSRGGRQVVGAALEAEELGVGARVAVETRLPRHHLGPRLLIHRVVHRHHGVDVRLGHVVRLALARQRIPEHLRAGVRPRLARPAVPALGDRRRRARRRQPRLLPRRRQLVRLARHQVRLVQLLPVHVVHRVPARVRPRLLRGRGCGRCWRRRFRRRLPRMRPARQLLRAQLRVIHRTLAFRRLLARAHILRTHRVVHVRCRRRQLKQCEPRVAQAMIGRRRLPHS